MTMRKRDFASIVLAAILSLLVIAGLLTRMHRLDDGFTRKCWVEDTREVICGVKGQAPVAYPNGVRTSAFFPESHAADVQVRLDHPDWDEGGRSEDDPHFDCWKDGNQACGPDHSDLRS